MPMTTVGQLRADIDDQYVEIAYVVSHKDVLFRVPKTKSYIFPKNGNLLSIFDTTDNFGSKRALTWGLHQ